MATTNNKYDNRHHQPPSDEVLEQMLRELDGDSPCPHQDGEGASETGERDAAMAEVMRLKGVVRKIYDPHRPDVEAEYREFKKRVDGDPVSAPTAKAQDETATDTPATGHARLRTMWTAIAACAACLAVYFTITRQSATGTTEQLKPGDVVLAASQTPDVVQLQDADGKTIDIDDLEAMAAIGARVTADGEMTLQAGGKDVPHQLEITIPRGKTFRLKLSDGSEVILNTDSRLYYPSAFSGEERRVRLEGEAYFKVARNESQPFIVETADMETRVLGTEFNVRAYSSRDAHVTLVRGSVSVTGRRSQQQEMLRPGEDATLATNGQLKKAEVDTDAYTYWSQGMFYFDDVSLEHVATDLGRWYNMNVVFQSEDAKRIPLHFAADRSDNVDAAIKLLNNLGNFQVNREGNTIYIDEIKK